MTEPRETDSACIFCQIASGDAPATVVDQSEHCLAFRDLNPQAPVHVLVVSRRHIIDAAELRPDDAEVLADMFVTATRVAGAEGVRERGFRLAFNVGDDASNSVPHLHLHVIGGRRLGWPPG